MRAHRHAHTHRWHIHTPHRHTHPTGLRPSHTVCSQHSCAGPPSLLLFMAASLITWLLGSLSHFCCTQIAGGTGCSIFYILSSAVVLGSERSRHSLVTRTFSKLPRSLLEKETGKPFDVKEIDLHSTPAPCQGPPASCPSSLPKDIECSSPRRFMFLEPSWISLLP